MATKKPTVSKSTKKNTAVKKAATKVYKNVKPVENKSATKKVVKKVPAKKVAKKAVAKKSAHKVQNLNQKSVTEYNIVKYPRKKQ